MLEIEWLECTTCYGSGKYGTERSYDLYIEDCKNCQGIGKVPTINVDNEVYEIPLVKRI
tara:strand:- start:110 stop:286 length:177 start_codon:yes stop_codon:yes gene_type:complete